jgi:hypothetical protein
MPAIPAPMTQTSVRTSAASAGRAFGGLVTIQSESVLPLSLSIEPRE